MFQVLLTFREKKPAPSLKACAPSSETDFDAGTNFPPALSDLLTFCHIKTIYWLYDVLREYTDFPMVSDQRCTDFK